MQASPPFPTQFFLFKEGGKAILLTSKILPKLSITAKQYIFA